MDGNQWQFSYLKGSARFFKIVEADTEEVARQLAQEWCDSKSVLLGGAMVEPLIVAKESTWRWKVKPGSRVEAAAAVTVETPASATTLANTIKEGFKEFVGR